MRETVTKSSSGNDEPEFDCPLTLVGAQPKVPHRTAGLQNFDERKSVDDRHGESTTPSRRPETGHPSCSRLNRHSCCVSLVCWMTLEPFYNFWAVNIDIPLEAAYSVFSL